MSATKETLSLYNAAEKGDSFLVSKYLNEGANVNFCNPNFDGRTPLIIASEKQHLEVVKILLRNGANIDSKTVYGGSALIYAAEAGYLDICQELINNKAEIDLRKSNGKTALILAALNGHLSICLELIKNGADINLVEYDEKCTALMFAVKKGHLEICKELVRNKADINIKDKDGKTALDRAKRSKMQALVEFLSNPTFEQKPNVITQNQNQLTSTSDVVKETQKQINRIQNNLLIQKNEFDNIQQFLTEDSHQSQPVRLSMTALSNCFGLIKELGPQKIATHNLLLEMQNSIEKSSTQIKVYHEDCQFDFRQQSEKYKSAENNLESHIKKMNELFEELVNLQKETFVLEKAKLKAKKELESSQSLLYESKIVLDQSIQVMERIDEVSKKNSEFMEKWNRKVLEGKVDLWNDDELRCLLECVDLEDWFDEIFTKINPATTNPNQLMTLKLTNKKKSMTWGEAKYFCIVVEQIKQKKEIPKIVNDIDLDEKNIKMWTVKNVFDYFQNNKNLNQVANILLEEKINGIVLFSSKEEEIKQLKKKNIDDSQFNFFIEELRKLKERWFTISQVISGAIPDDIICPLCHQVMIDPAVTQDGYTYERKAIEEWLKFHDTSPITGEVIEKIIFPNEIARKLCKKWRQSNSQ